MNSPFMPTDVAAWWQVISTAGENLQARELFRFVYAAIQKNTHSAEIEQALIWAESLQDCDPESETFGNFRWYRRNPKPVDRNAVEFCMEVGILVWIDHKDSLSPQAKERLERLIRLSIEGIRRHTPQVSYTNIYTMKMWNCIGIGEGLPAEDLAQEGYVMLDLWLAEVAQNGIHEYVSPTYSPVSMECLENIARYTQNSIVREKVNRALRFCWLQLAANWFPKCQRLAGAHSRDYDYLGTGVRNARVRHRMDSLFQASGSGDGNTEVYLPDVSLQQDVEKMVADVPRLVCQKWGPEPWEVSTTYVGRKFAIGSAGAGYGPIDKCLTVHLGDKDTANVNFFCDARGDFYGQRQFELSDGHSKALHLVPSIASVQREAEVLFLAAPKPEGRHFHRSAPNPTCLLSHLIIPVGCEVYLGEEKLCVAAGLARAVSPDLPIFLRYDDVVIGMRVVVATTEKGEQAPVTFVCDQEGLDCGVMRLTCTHAEHAPKAGGMIGIWMGCQEDVTPEMLEAFQAHFGQEVDVNLNNDKLAVRVPGWHEDLRVVVDAQTRLETSGGMCDPSNVLFCVNGHDIGKDLLSDFKMV